MSHPALLLRDAIQAARAELEQRYDVLVDSTVWSWSGGGLHVEGSVLVAAQADTYQRAVQQALGPDRPLADWPRPPVLADLSTAFYLQNWGRIRSGRIVDVYRSPEGDDLQTQWSEAAMVRVFLRRDEGRSLIQLPDGTVGWVDSELVGGGGTQPSSDPWRRYVRPHVGRAIDPRSGTLSGTARIARARLGRPYRWGGNRQEAADCSGFVQAVVYEGAGILLPKNTREQMRKGSRVAATSVRPGDVLFVRGRSKNLMHVGLVLPGLPKPDQGHRGRTVIHSCLSRGTVIEEPLDDFLEIYRFTGARRIVAWPGLELQ